MNKIVNQYKRISKTTKIQISLLILFCLIQVLAITKFEFIFGSNVDWMKQHIIFPDYFRKLFYQTGNLFPNFAPHLGAGQNIFYFAYYGLYNPIIVISYLLPFIPMDIYIIISSILCVIVSIILCYYFLRKNGFSNNICFFISLLFLFSSSYLFHSHRHIMFVNYMPFLILALIGVWRYFEKKKSALLIVSICLLILTSYYYSISGIIVICLYGLFYYLKKMIKTDNLNFKQLIKNEILFLIRVLIGVLLASILLLPLIYIILNGRGTVINTYDLSLLKPNIPLEFLMYGTYGVGLTAILWIALIYNIVYLPKGNRILSILTLILISFPIFNYLLNGNLYLNGKVWIPFIPLFLFMIASMLKDIKNHTIHFRWLFLLVLGSAFLLFKFTDRKILFLMEEALTIYLLYLYQKKSKYRYLVPIVLLSIFVSSANHLQDNLVTIGELQKQHSYQNYDVLEYINYNEASMYRYQDDLSGANGINYSSGNLDYRTTLYSSTSNPNYWNSFYSVFNNNDIYRNHFMLAQTNNLFFQRFMGIRYLLTNQNPPFGYQKAKVYEEGILYENKNVYPIAFSSSYLLNNSEYQELTFDEKLEAYQNNIIINGPSKNPNLNFKIISTTLNTTIKETKNLTYQKTDTGYHIKSEKNGKIVLQLDSPIQDSTLIIRFRMNTIPSCKNGDTFITINGIMNKLTCKSWKYYNHNETFDYVLSSNNPIQELVTDFAKGNYDISNIEIYQIPNSYFAKENDITPLKIDKKKSKGDILEGSINTKKDGYLMFTIPYDKGFQLWIDEKEVEIEKVNEAFIGAPITKGTHKVKLKFTAPYSSLGKTFSIASIGILGTIIILEKKRLINK